MDNQFIRTQMLIGDDGVEKLKNSHIAVFGIGGVGGYVVEGLVRAGVGKLSLIDNDKVSVSNINRQIIATHNTIMQYKTKAAEQRCKSINPNLEIYTHNTFFTSEASAEFDFSSYDYVVDAIDTVTGKIELIMQCNKVNTPIISSMGTGNKLDATKFEIADIYDTSVCPLARVMRRELKKRGIERLKVLYSKEEPIAPLFIPENEATKKIPPASISFVPSVAGLIIAGEVVKDILKY